jgi:hypothetical protein
MEGSPPYEHELARISASEVRGGWPSPRSKNGPLGECSGPSPRTLLEVDAHHGSAEGPAADLREPGRGEDADVADVELAPWSRCRPRSQQADANDRRRARPDSRCLAPPPRAWRTNAVNSPRWGGEPGLSLVLVVRVWKMVLGPKRCPHGKRRPSRSRATCAVSSASAWPPQPTRPQTDHAMPHPRSANPPRTRPTVQSV